MNDQEKKVLEHQLEEWKLLNGYINSIDLSYQQPFVIIMAIIAGLATFLSEESGEFKLALFILPLGLAAVTAYVSYQFRIVAILRGHLARLEERMNETLGENVHMWNSALVETYMAHNNVVNNWMMVPMFAFCIFVLLYCLVDTWNMVLQGNVNFWICAVYWAVVLGSFLLIIAPPFLRNGKIRYRTYHEEDVWRDYAEYKGKQIKKYEDRRRRCSSKDTGSVGVEQATEVGPIVDPTK